jgi:hypoxanthine phosphoribosyltransferase
MQADIERVLISREQIARRVRELAGDITRDFAGGVAGRGGAGRDGAEMTIVAVMTGALVFCGDLIREIPIAMKMGLLIVSSYPGRSVAAKGVQVLGHRLGDVRGHHVLVVDDILDSGGTIKHVVPMLRDLGAAEVRTCVLLRKDRPAARAIPVEYVGFDIPDEFIVGYGLDYNDYYRNLPEIVTLKRSVFATSSPGMPGEGRGEGSRGSLSTVVNQKYPSPYPSPGVPGEGTDRGGAH